MKSPLKSGGALLAAFLTTLLAGCTTPPPPPPDPVTLEQIIAMSSEGRTPEEIIQKIAKSRTLYELKTEDVLRLTDGGVDPVVIDFMLETHRRYIRYRYSYPYYYDPWWYGPYAPPFVYYW